MKKFWIQFSILIITALGLLYLGFNSQFLTPYLPVSGGNLTKTQIQIAGATVDVEVADTPSKRSRGLSGRASLLPNSGMIFAFPEEKKYQFWMKGMKFPIDMIFIRKGVVVDILRNVPILEPNTPDQNLPLYSPVAPIDMLLEVTAGFTDAQNVRVGDSVFLIK
ncbi:hypothetical protein A2617_00200 [Candidatus Daviesbacteria bacterium RIFOXYD1_FULL_41_10]|uniref:DUF192 domain-containing protein n=1 Tax=Candidatus Daviesbacteria bacterium RIFOXYD1_FULL_41_10 TaxID=1797801 RepID=A0A1F5N083_9BACT|nr:MAG: hypothetical protein A2617_00200 [Candidatus Daviesbacteria bacterium RIFOXYD1_FULL_41_10]